MDAELITKHGEEFDQFDREGSTEDQARGVGFIASKASTIGETEE